MVSEARRNSRDLSILDDLAVRASDRRDRVRHGYAWGFWLKHEIKPVMTGVADKAADGVRIVREGARSFFQEFAEESEPTSRRTLEGTTLRAVAATVAGQTVDLARAARENLGEVADRALLNLVGEMPVGLPRPEETVVGIHPKLVEQLMNGVGAKQ